MGNWAKEFWEFGAEAFIILDSQPFFNSAKQQEKKNKTDIAINNIFISLTY
jgi:hypothetical protein